MSHDTIIKHRQNPPAECRIQLAGAGLHLGRSGRSLDPTVWLVAQTGLPLSSGSPANRFTSLGRASPSIPITIKIPADVVKRLRSHAQTSGMTIGEIVGHAIVSFLDKLHRHG